MSEGMIFILDVGGNDLTYAFQMFSNTLFLCLQLPGDEILGLAKFFLSIGIPGDTKDFFNQIDSLASLENNRQVMHGNVCLLPKFLLIRNVNIWTR